MKLPGDSKVNQKKSCIENEFDPLTMNTFQQRPKLKTNIIANSDGEESDSDSYSSDAEIDVPKRIIESNSNEELIDQFNNLSVSEQSKCSQIVEGNDFSSEQNSIDDAKTDEKLIPRGPIPKRNDTKFTRRTSAQPYSLKIFSQSQNVFKLNFNTRTLIVELLDSKSRLLFTFDELKQLAENELRKLSSNEVQGLNSDILMSASQRLDDKADQLRSIYDQKYIDVLKGFKDDPENLKKELFTLLKEKRSDVDDRWLLNIYAHITYIDKVGKEEFVRILTSKHEGLSLLYIACMNHPDLPLAARFIAEVMVKHNINVNEVYNDNNSLMHVLAYKGDTHVQLLAELLQVKTNINRPVFDINCRNNYLQTLLHCAVIGHSSQNSCYSTIKHLVDHGAEILQDINGRTPLHYAILKGCGSNIVKHLLPVSALNIIDLKDSQGNTALHLAYKTFPETKQEIISILIANNANQKIQNINGELPCPGMKELNQENCCFNVSNEV